MIYRAKHHFFIYPFFQKYGNWIIKRNFHDVIIMGEFRDRDLPLLLISNHMSWWDGFWADYLNIKLFHRKFHFMMLEEQLMKYRFFNKCGGYSIKKHSKSVIETLNYTAQLLADNNNLVLIFPQGRIESLYTKSLKFEKGLEYILRKIPGEIHILFSINLIEYLSNPKPTLFIYLKEHKGSTTIHELEKEYNDFYSSCISENMKLAEEG